MSYNQYNNFHQHAPGPPQPQWQSNNQPGRQGWGDPRPGPASPAVSTPSASFHNYGTAPGQTLPPPPPPPPGGFPPAPQVNAPAVAHQDTSAWGVKYNHGQAASQVQNALRPPLPPRPSSAQSGQQQWNQTPLNNGPTPPPRPAEYAIQPQQTQSQFFPHEQYSHRPTSHLYEPQQNQLQTQQPQNATQSWQQPGGMYHKPGEAEAPVSPLEQYQSGWNYANARPPSVIQSQVPQAMHTPGPQMPYDRPSSTAPVYAGVPDWSHTPSNAGSQPPQQAFHTSQQSQSFSITPEQIHATPAQVSPGQPAATLYQSSPPHVQQNFQQSESQPWQDHHSHFPSISTNPQLARVDTDVSSSAASKLRRSGTIDSVIQAWNSPTAAENVQPLGFGRKPIATSTEPNKPRTELKNSDTQTDFPPITKTETKIVTQIETREIDPYEDLKNEYRTSLNRYATMLRQEMSAQSEQEKMKVVVDFVNREVKLRSVMFGAEPAELVTTKELTALRDAKAKADNAQSTSSTEIQTFKAAKDQAETNWRNTLAELTSVRDELKKAEQNERSLSDQLANVKAELEKAKSVSVVPPVVQLKSAQSSPPPPIQTDFASQRSAKDDGFVVVSHPEGADDDEYSPGGRPKMVGIARAPQSRPKTPTAQTASGQSSKPYQSSTTPESPSANAPMTLDDYAMPEQTLAPGSRQASIPQIQSLHLMSGPHGASTGPHPAVTPIPFQPARPAYMPFTYNPSATAAPVVNVTNPANEAYSKLRNEQAADSGRVLSQEPPILTVTGPDRGQNATPSRAKQQQEEAFIGLLRQQSKAIRRPATASPGPDAPAPLRAGTPLQRRPSLPPMVKSTESLRKSLPGDVAQLQVGAQVHEKLEPILSSLAQLVDDFSFIHATVVAWDKENRKIRHQLDTDRASRESDSQARIDELFHDNQIGYADIAGLEEDFKLEEASRKYQEDQAELESFIRNVFERVTDKLDKDLAELETLRVKALDVLDLESQSASARLKLAVKSPHLPVDKASLAAAMDVMLQIYHKIELRHTKIAEASFERERRRKRLELSVFYTNGDTPGVKKLEKDFDKAQALQVLAEARKRDERANKLMDSFDRAVVKGLAENQEWLDDVSNKASLLRDLVLGAESNGPQGSNREELLYGPGGIKETIDLLDLAVNQVLQDSKELVAMSGQADRLLNEADFAMFLAEAKIADATEQDFQKLRAEKVKEDQKLKDEADGRMSGVQRVPEEILGFIKDVRDNIGNDKDHQTRINQALEMAKKRNQGE